MPTTISKYHKTQMLRTIYLLNKRWGSSSLIQRAVKPMPNCYRQACLRQSFSSNSSNTGNNASYGTNGTNVEIPIIQEHILRPSDEIKEKDICDHSNKHIASLHHDLVYCHERLQQKKYVFATDAITGSGTNILCPPSLNIASAKTYQPNNNHLIFTTKTRIENIPENLSTSHRSMSSSSMMADLVPEFVKQYSIWGGSAIILKTFHGQNIPYWACISLTNILVRTSLFPLVIQGAKTSVRFANVAPEVQFLISCYTRDAKTLKDANAPPSQRMELLVATWQSLRGIYKLHKVNPFDVLKSPLMQIPVFWYFSVDIRKLINGGNPELAQELTESGFLWVMDLTEPDPWYGLPILSGLLLYLNVEVAVGKQSLSGETASKSNIARYLKDGFQSLAVLMPCFMAQSPAGVQIYLLTSFTFTLFQGAALRNDAFRQMVGLPPRGAPLPEGKLVKEFILYNKLERETYGVLSPKFHSSFKPYAHLMSPEEMKRMEQKAKQSKQMNNSGTFDGVGVWAPDSQPSFQPSPAYLIAQGIKHAVEKEKKRGQNMISADRVIEVAPSPDEIMEAANRGEKPAAPIRIASEAKLDSTPLTLNTRNILKKRGNNRKRR